MLKSTFRFESGIFSGHTLAFLQAVAVTILVSALKQCFKGSYSDVRRSPQKLKLFGDPIKGIRVQRYKKNPTCAREYSKKALSRAHFYVNRL